MSILNDMFGGMPTGFQQALHKYAEVRLHAVLAWLNDRKPHADGDAVLALHGGWVPEHSCLYACTVRTVPSVSAEDFCCP
jgi:hypothetical protein